MAAQHTSDDDLDPRPLWTVADRLRKAREAAGFDHQADLAKRIGCSRATVSSYERGGATSRTILRLWAQETGVPLEWILRGYGPESDEGLPQSRCTQPSLFTVEDNSHPADMATAA